MLYFSSCFLISYITNNFLKNQYFNKGLYFNKQICLSLLFRSYYSLWLYDGGKKYSKLEFKFYTLTILRENFETFNLIRVKSVGPEMKLQIATFFIKGNRILRYGCRTFDTFLGFSDFFLWSPHETMKIKVV